MCKGQRSRFATSAGRRRRMSSIRLGRGHCLGRSPRSDSCEGRMQCGGSERREGIEAAEEGRGRKGRDEKRRKRRRKRKSERNIRGSVEEQSGAAAFDARCSSDEEGERVSEREREREQRKPHTQKPTHELAAASPEISVRSKVTSNPMFIAVPAARRRNRSTPSATSSLLSTASLLSRRRRVGTSVHSPSCTWSAFTSTHIEIALMKSCFSSPPKLAHVSGTIWYVVSTFPSELSADDPTVSSFTSV